MHSKLQVAQQSANIACPYRLYVRPSHLGLQRVQHLDRLLPLPRLGVDLQQDSRHWVSFASVPAVFNRHMPGAHGVRSHLDRLSQVNCDDMTAAAEQDGTAAG